MALVFSPSESSQIAQVESSDGSARSGFGMFFVCSQRGLEHKWKRGHYTHQIKPLFLQSIHYNLECLIRYFVELFLLALSIECVKPFLVYLTCQLHTHDINSENHDLVRPYHIQPGLRAHSRAALSN